MTRVPDLRRAARMAYRVLAARQIDSLPVQPLPLLRACRDTRVLTGDEAAELLDMPASLFDRLFDRTDAFTLQRELHGRTQYIVVYRPDGNPARLRFTLAHELGHRLLGHTSTSGAEEREADCFASHLLCPEPVMMRLRERFGALCAEQVASACYVSLSCARTLALRHMPPVEDELLQAVNELLLPAASAAAPLKSRGRLHWLPQKTE